jgi:anthranilate 1,2-dioxygenase large subunit
VPNRVYHSPDLHTQEMERIFQGDAWLFMGFDAEVPNVGDFKTTYLGEVPVVFNRTPDGDVHGFVNRCAHRGAIIRREASGNAKDHICIYHQWCYDQRGTLVGVPFQRGIGGQGGVSKEFRREDHNLRRLRVQGYKGLLFATFSETAEDLLDYLGTTITEHITKVMHGKVQILGYQRQTVRGNWKLYAENSRDQYHGSLLHKFLGTFLTKTTTQGGLTLDKRHRHSLIYSNPTKTFTGPLSDSADLVHNVDSFEDNRVFQFLPEFGPEYEYGNAICSIFPNMVFQQIRNSLVARQVRPQGSDRFELLWTIFGFEDDDEALRNLRLLQVNMGGPGGFVSSEDGEAIELVHKATASQPDSTSVLEMGGTGPIPDRVTTRMNELAIRGFWSYYSELMGTEPVDAVR